MHRTSNRKQHDQGEPSRQRGRRNNSRRAEPLANENQDLDPHYDQETSSHSHEEIPITAREDQGNSNQKYRKIEPWPYNPAVDFDPLAIAGPDARISQHGDLLRQR